MIKSIGGAVRAQEAFSILLHEGEQGGLLFVAQIQLAGGIEHHGIEIIQIFGIIVQLLFRDQLRIGAQIGVPKAALLAQLFDGGHGVRDGIVLEAFDFADEEQLLFRRVLGLRGGANAEGEERARVQASSS